MRNKYPVYVISKGRPQSCLTARELKAMGVDFTLVVEPQEYELYERVHDNILVTPFSNLGQGSIPVRNFVWEDSVNKGCEKHWVLDDNIEGFHRLNRNEKPKVLSPVFFRCMEDFTDRYTNVALSGPNYYSLCKSTDGVPPYYLNTRVYSCILVNNSLEHRWRGMYNEDTDLSLRVLKDGWSTILFNAFLAGKVTTMRMKGGNTNDLYANTNNRKEFADSLQEQHPDVVKVTWKFNRWHHQVDYRSFKQNKLVLKEGLQIKDHINEYGMKLVSIKKNSREKRT